jgi:hydroxymethylbilane synthase
MLIIGSRGSQLALWQSNHIKSKLEEMGHEVRIEVIKTKGDLIQNVALKEIGNKGLFTKELEDALLDGSVHLAVHSLKDMPTELPAGLQLTATPPREDTRDVLVGKTLSELQPGMRVGSGSLRRVAQMRMLVPGVSVEPIRGNVDTRLRKLDEGQYDAIVLAAAGLRRLGWQDRIAEYLTPEQMCPAVGQGSLAIETRADGGPGLEAALKLDDANTRAAVTCERAVLAELGGGCQVPIGAYAEVHGDRLSVRAIVVATDGSRIVRVTGEGPASEAARLGSELGQELLSRGGAQILEEVYG